MDIEYLEKRLTELNKQQMAAQIRQRQASDAAQKASIDIMTISGQIQEITFLIAEIKAQEAKKGTTGNT
jgi:hypothetical protein